MLDRMKAAIVLAVVLLSPWAASTVLTTAGVRVQFEKGLLGALPPREPPAAVAIPVADTPPPKGWRDDLYLAANPDVAAAVVAGAVPSGFVHYHRFGRTEGRHLAPASASLPASPRPAEKETAPPAVAAAGQDLIPPSAPRPVPASQSLPAVMRPAVLPEKEAPADTVGGPVVRMVRFGHHPGFVRVVLETTGPVAAHPVAVADRRSLAVDLAGGWTAPFRGADRKVGPLLSYAAEAAGVKARLVLRAERPIVLRQSFALPPDGDRGHRLVFDLAVAGAL